MGRLYVVGSENPNAAVLPAAGLPRWYFWVDGAALFGLALWTLAWSQGRDESLGPRLFLPIIEVCLRF